MLAFRHLAVVFALAVGPHAMAQTTPPAQPVIVFAAASLKESLDEVAAAWKACSGVDVRISYAGSLALARQIEQGAPADLFASADLDSMNYAQARNAIQPATRFDLLQNRLVVIAPSAASPSSMPLTVEGFRAALGGGRLATGDVDSVPAGKYAKAALEKLGLWTSLRHRLAMTDNVRAALVFVARREAPLGIVYATDAAADPAVRVVATFPADAHPPIVYPVALTSASKNPAAQAFLQFLKSPDARALFEKRGFVVLG